MKLNLLTRSAAALLFTGAVVASQANVAAASPLMAVDARQAVHAGELCDRSASIVAFGNQIKVRLSPGKAVLLPSDGDLASRSSCAIRIPVTVPVGYYLNKVTTRAQATVSKPQGNSISIVLRTSLFGYEGLTVQSDLDESVSTSGLVNTYRAFAGSSPLATEWRQKLCAPNRTATGLLAINLADVIQREDSGDLVSLDFSGLSRGIDIWTELKACP